MAPRPHRDRPRGDRPAPREDTLSGIVTLRRHIATGRAVTLADAAVQLRRLAALTEAENGAGLRSVLSSPGAGALVASAPAVVEREADVA